MFNLGTLLWERGETTEAEQWYRKAAVLNLPQAMSNLAALLEKRGETTEAEQWFGKADALNAELSS